MNENKTLCISDLDGTLLNQNPELSQYTKNALNRMMADGLHFSVATARTAATAFKILDGVQWSVPLILLNGVLIYDAGHRRYAQISSIPSPLVTEIISTLRELKTTGLMYQLKNDEQLTYYEMLEHRPIRAFMEERVIRYNKVFLKVSSFAEVPQKNIIYFTLLDTQRKIQPAQDALSKIPGIGLSLSKDIYSSDLWYLEIHSDKASKQNAIAYLRADYGFEHIIGFGDNLNDLPLFAACDVRVAVENAKDEVKNAADFICDTNENDGVVKWIEAKING
jgi:Cof subfamily protein (haloacid dehalogenase superfamily)